MVPDEGIESAHEPLDDDLDRVGDGHDVGTPGPARVELVDHEPEARPPLFAQSSPLTDLALTLPIFVLYHLLVILLPVRNAADWVTQELVLLSDHSRLAYFGLTGGFGICMVGVLLLAGRGHVLHYRSFLLLALEGLVYAVAMRLIAAAVVGRLFLGGLVDGAFTGLVMSLGAGFYEELAFRVVGFGLGLRALRLLARPDTRLRRLGLAVAWALICSLAFSGWHHLGALGEAFEARAFVFRAVCGLVFTLIYSVRGFAPVVWTHVAYDVWVLVF